MLKLNNREIKFKRNIAKFTTEFYTINNRYINPSDFEGNIEELYNYFDLSPDEFSIEFVIKMLNLVYIDKYSELFLMKYVNMCGESNFSDERWARYYNRENKNTANTPEFFKLVYGDYWKEELAKQKSKRQSMYSPEYVMKRDNISYDEAITQINNLKKNKATSKENFVKKHGKEKGAEMFEKFQNTSKHTKEKYIELHGDALGKEKWKEYTEIKRKTSVRCIDFWMKDGVSEEEARTNLIKFQKETSPIHKEYWILNGYSEEEAKEKTLIYDRDSASVDFFKKKYNDTWEEEFYKYHKSKTIEFGKASKQSLEYFTLLHNKLLESGIKDSDIYYGIENKNELLLFYFDEDKQKDRYLLYDFTINNKKLIIEFHGHRFHPNPGMDNDKWVEWKSLVNVDVETAWKKDLRKEKVAIDNGYKYMCFYSDDKKEYNWNKIRIFLSENNINIKL